MHTQAAIRRPICISFSGIDGAGKSTQIANLRARIERSGASVQLITFWDDVARFTRLRETSGHILFKGDKGVGTPDKPISRRDKNVRSWLMSLFRLCIYFADAVSLRMVVRRTVDSGADVIIFDRYAYDELSNLALNNPVNRVYARLLMKIVPRPHVSLLLDADPIQARARKPEYPLEFLYTSRSSYMTLRDVIGGITIIDPMPIQDVEQHVWKHILEQLSPEKIRDLQSETFATENDVCAHLDE